MGRNKAQEREASKAWAIFGEVVSKAVSGAGKLSGSCELAERYLANPRYGSQEDCAQALIRKESMKCAVVGFGTGFGGLMMLPASLPADVLGSLALQARMVGAVAHIYGYNTRDEPTLTLVGLCMLGGQGANTVKDVLGKASQQFTVRAIRAIPRELLTRINQLVGMRFVTKFGTTGVVNLGKAVPAVGSSVSGAVDYALCRAVGRLSMRLFGPEQGDILDMAPREEGSPPVLLQSVHLGQDWSPEYN